MSPVDPLYPLSLVSTAGNVAGCLLLVVATLRRRRPLLLAGAATASGATLAATVAVWPPTRWTAPVTVFGVVVAAPLFGVVLCLAGYRRVRSLSVVGAAILLAAALLSIPVFGERFVAP
jgi:hypothetical protein